MLILLNRLFGNYLSHGRNHTRTSTCDVFDLGRLKSDNGTNEMFIWHVWYMHML